MANKDYWKKRAEERKNHVSRSADEAAEEARGAYERARHQINKEVAYWIQKIADAEGISYEEARKRLEAGELNEFRMTLEEYIARGEALGVAPEWQEAMVKASALHHIDRLNALKAIIRAALEENKAAQKRTGWMHDMADYSFQHTLFALETDAEVAIQFRLPDLDTLHKDIEEAWAPDGIDFVERVGINNDKLAAEVDRLLTQGCITGETYDELSKQLNEQFDLKEYEAERIIRTEATRVASMSEAAAYRAAGIEEYEILVTLDEKTCRICGPLDGHVEKVEDLEPGITAPPFHPNCRCTTIGHYEDDLPDETRIARDEDGNPIHVDGSMTWEEWKAGHSLAKNIEMPSETEDSKAIPQDIKDEIERVINNIQEEYDVKIDNDNIIYHDISYKGKIPFQFMPVEKDGKYFPQLIINTGYDWNENLESFNERIYNNYIKGTLASQNTEELLLHEMAHIITFQECKTMAEYLAKEKSVEKLFVPGVSKYNNTAQDGAETIAEGWVAMRRGDDVPPDIVVLVNNHIERRRKK